MSIETHEISFSFDHPDKILNPLLMLLQQALIVPGIKTSKVLPLLNLREVLVIDANKERSSYITNILSSAGFRPTAFSTALEAFTHFLKVPFVPCAIILGQEDANDRFFLLRLRRQISQKFDWDSPLICLNPQMPVPSVPSVQFASPVTPLPAHRTDGELHSQKSISLPPQTTDQFSMQTTSPLSPVKLSSSSASSPAIAGPLTPAAPIQQDANEEQEKLNISLEGQNIGRYQIHAPLGNGAGSSVYLIYDRLRENNMALKAVSTKAIVYHTGKQEKAEDHYFQREVDLIARLKHPHILPLLSCGETYISGFPFIYKVMPYCEEGSLADWLLQNGGSKLFSIQEVSHIVSQLAEALQFVHDHHVTYQNVKLTNLLIQGKAKIMRQLHLLLADFPVVQDGTYTIKPNTTLQYTAPEQWNGFSLPASDQYSLAVIAYELLTGRPPFQGQSEQIMKRMHMTMTPQPTTIFNPSIPPHVNNILLHALAKKPEERFSSIKTFADALRQFAN